MDTPNQMNQNSQMPNTNQQPVSVGKSKVWIILVLIVLLVGIGYIIANKPNGKAVTGQTVTDKNDGEVENGEQIFKK